MRKYMYSKCCFSYFIFFVVLTLSFCTCFTHHKQLFSSTSSHIRFQTIRSSLPNYNNKLISPSNMIPKINKYKHELSMSLTPLSKTQIQRIFPTSVTNEQWLSHWGVNKKERLQRILESVLISYGGGWLAWFLSFLAGGLVSGIVGTLLIFNWIYTPWLMANRRNYAFRSKGLYYGLYNARIKSLKRIRRRAGRTIGSASQEFLRVVAEDECGRSLEVVTEWQDDYKDLRVRMPFRTVVISPRRDFSELASVTDGWVPARGVWVGDYPYLRRAEFASLCKSLRIFSGTTTTSRSSSRSSGGKSQVDWKNKDSADVSIDDPENLDPSDSDGNNNRGFNQGGDRGGDRGDGVSDSPYRSEYEAFDELDTEIINYSEDDYSSDINYSDDINSVEYEGKGDIEGDDDEGDLTDVEVVSMTAKRVRVIDRKNEYNGRPLRRIRPVEERS